MACEIDGGAAQVCRPLSLRFHAGRSSRRALVTSVQNFSFHWKAAHAKPIIRTIAILSLSK